jgi:hypothetical protein
MTETSKANDKKNVFFLINYMFGFIFFVGSFVLLFWHEGNVNNDISVYANRSTNAILVNPDNPTEIDASSITDLTDINAIPLNFLSGELSSSTPVGIDILLDGQYAAVRRVAEMYSWQAVPKRLENGRTQYSYNKGWTAAPDLHIDDPEHVNPDKSLESKIVISNSLNIKDIEINKRSLKLDNENIWTTIKTNSDKYISGTAENFPNDGTYFYQNDEKQPTIGDIRIKYQIIPLSKTVTIFGVLDKNSLIKHTSDLGRQLFSLFDGDKKSAIKSLRSETFIYKTWGIRLLSVFIMVLGVKMLMPSIASTVESSSFCSYQEIIIPKFAAFITTIIIATAAIISASIEHSITHLIGLGILLIILIFVTIIIANKIAYKKAHEEEPTFEIIEEHKEEEKENGEEGSEQKPKPKKKKEPPKPIDMVSKEELGVDDMSITLSSGEVVDEHGHGILPADMPQAGVGHPVKAQPFLDDSSEPIELTLGEAIKPTPKKSPTPPSLPEGNIMPEQPNKPKSLFDSDET